MCQKKLKMVLHIIAHNFLNIQPIFNPIEVLESCNLELSNYTSNAMYIKACWRCQK